MEGQFAAPFHFAAEFLVLVVAIGAAFDSVRSARHGAGRWAFGQAVGFLVLGAAQTAHGALVASAEADLTVVGLRAGAFVVLALVARPGAAVTRIPAAAGPATVVAPALFVPGVNASYALIPTLAAVAVAVRGAAAHRRDQDPATFAFAAAFVAFAAAEASVAVASPDGGRWLAASHGLRTLAALFLARWLWTSIVRSVRMRFVASSVAVLTVLVLVIGAALNLVIGGTLEREELKRLQDAGRARIVSVRTLAESAAGAAQSLATERIADRFRAKDRRYFTALIPGAIRLIPANADVLAYVDDRGRMVASLENATAPAQPRKLSRAHEVAIAGTGVVSEALRSGNLSASAEPLTYATPAGTQTEVVVIGASPAKLRGKVAGAVVVVYRIDDGFLGEVEQDTGAAATLVVSDSIAATTFEQPASVAQAIAPHRDALRLARERAGAVSLRTSIDGSGYISEFVPVQSEDGQVVAQLALSRRVAVLDEAQRSISRTLFLITLLAVMIASVLAWLTAGRVTKPIRSLTAAARELREGNLEARARVAAADEVGTLGTAFNEMAVELQRTTGALRSAAVEESTLRARMEAILQSMGDGLVATDARGVVVTFNRAAEAIFGRSAADAVGRPIGEVVDGVAKGSRSLADAAMRGLSTEGTAVQASGARLPVALSSAPLVDDAGNEAGRVVVVRDMRREMEAERMKSEFLSNVSHELRTPITPIKGYAEILSRRKFPREKTEQFLEGILESTERLERIVEILVDFAALEAGRLKPKQDPLDIEQMLDDAVARWRGRSGAHQIVRRRVGRLPSVRGDARLLGRALNELLDNAVKFSPDGGRIEVGAESDGSRGSGRAVRVTIKDRGIGIEAEQMPTLFQDFHQLDGSETRAYGGLGLGLAYAKRIMVAHGGDVVVESAPGKGSTFSLVVPAADAAKVDAPPARAPRPERSGSAPEPAPVAQARADAPRTDGPKKKQMKSGVLNIRRGRR